MNLDRRNVLVISVATVIILLGGLWIALTANNHADHEHTVQIKTRTEACVKHATNVDACLARIP